MYDELVLFIKIVKLGSFSKASKSTGISASNLTRKIQHFEKDLNFVLLKRDTRSVELTRTGQQLYDKFCDLETEYDQAVAEIEHSNNDLSGSINVLLPPFFALKVITPHLVDFLIKFPKIKLNITYSNIQTNLVKDDFDLAIINHRPLKGSQKIRLLCRGKIIFCCYPEYIRQFGTPSTQAEIEEKLIMGVVLDHEISDKIAYIINAKTAQKTIFSQKYRIIQNSGAHDIELAQSGKIIAAGMDIMLTHDLESGAIIRLLPDCYLPGFDYFLLINPEGKNARIEVFINFINECLASLNLNDNLSMP